MRMSSGLIKAMCLLAAITLSACPRGGSGPEEPDTESSSEEEDEDDWADDDEGGEEEEAKKTGEPEVPEMTPKRIIMQSDVLWMFSFNDSDLGEKQREKCEKKSKGDPEKRAQCLSKAQKSVKVEGIRFKEDKEEPDVWWFTKFSEVHGKPTNLNRIQFEVDSETEDSVTLKFKGRDQGTKRAAFPPKMVIGVPSEFRIEIDDKRKGKMVYKARMGAVEDK